MYSSLFGGEGYPALVCDSDAAKRTLSKLEKFIDDESISYPKSMRSRQAENMLWAIYRGVELSRQVYDAIDEFYMRHFGHHAPLTVIKDVTLQR